MSSNLRSPCVADQFRDAFLAEETGTLEVQSTGPTFLVEFHRGLVCGGGIRRPEGGESARSPIAEVVKEAFGCVPIEVAFRAGDPAEAEPGTDLLETLCCFLDGIRVMAGFDLVRDALAASHNTIVLRPNPAVPIERITLSPVHGFVLSRLMSGLSFCDLRATVGSEDEDEASRFVYALLLLGTAVLDPPVADGPFRTDLLIAEHSRDFAREASERSLIEESYRAVVSLKPYAVLGIPESAGPEEIRRAYDEKRRVLAAERFMPKIRDSMRTELGIIEARLTETYLALLGQDLGGARGQGEGSSDLGAAQLRREFVKTEVAASADEQMQMAEQYYATARKHFSSGDYYNCIQFCSQAIRQNDQAAQYYFLMGEAQARNPERRWQKMAEQSYQQAIRLDPWNADYLVALGQFYRKNGLRARAKRQFERAIELQPSHAKAKEELAIP